ncbi:hypothetical protein [Kibdelosporangium philippinense]|uniref:hypothetical protein n=1 Tax=Kibdelosporangium philippinense TaxID=211113 RepID=UPI0036130502
MSHKRSATALLAGLVACGLAVPVSGTATAAPVTGAASPDRAVTLFTGDKVVLDGEHGVTVLAGKGREGTRFSFHTDERGDIHVIPEDVRPLLRADKLDQRLFNVTQLIDNGYDDKTRPDIPLIVSGGVGLAKERHLPSLNASVVRVDKAAGLRTFATADKDLAGRPGSGVPGQEHPADRCTGGVEFRAHRQRRHCGRAGHRHRRHTSRSDWRCRWRAGFHWFRQWCRRP